MLTSWWGWSGPISIPPNRCQALSEFVSELRIASHIIDYSVTYRYLNSSMIWYFWLLQFKHKSRKIMAIITFIRDHSNLRFIRHELLHELFSKYAFTLAIRSTFLCTEKFNNRLCTHLYSYCFCNWMDWKIHEIVHAL